MTGPDSPLLRFIDHSFSHANKQKPMDKEEWDACAIVMAYKDGRQVFVAVIPDRLTEVTDHLFDNGFKVGQCARWFFRQNLLENKECYIVDGAENFELPPQESKGSLEDKE